MRLFYSELSKTTMNLLLGDCLEKLKELEDNSVDAIVTDPPYGLSFMGKKWDYDVPSVDIWKECLRVLKPGGYLLSFAGTRTQHRMAVNIEDAGFEIRDMIAWVYGSGFPKSLNIGKAVEGKVLYNNSNTTQFRKIKGETKRIVNGYTKMENEQGNKPANYNDRNGESVIKPEFETEEAKEWEGWGTATKPAVEPVSICAKPLPPSIIYAIMGIDLTNKIISLCQKSNANVNDVESILRSFQQLLEKAGVNTVHENARTLNWENIESVIIAAVNFISQKHTSKEQAEEIKEVSVQENANQNGKNNLLENSIQTGKAESLSEKMDILLSILVTRNIDSNTISLWKSILEDTLKKANTFTTETALKTIIAWKIYNSLLSANTQNFTSPNKSISPALEPITVARKPLEKGLNVAQNCLKWGVGGINIDGCRISHNEETKTANRKQRSAGWNPDNCGFDSTNNTVASANPTGRFPANLIHDGSEEVVGLFPQTKGGGSQNGSRKWKGEDGEGGFGGWAGKVSTDNYISRDDGTGSASRFFYCAKASKRERNIGCEGLEEKTSPNNLCSGSVQKSGEGTRLDGKPLAKNTNNHPTVKPLALMEYLVKLVSREGHIVLDPFMGSGTTGIACKKLNRDFIGIEMMPEYMEIAKCRIDGTKEEN